MDFDQNIRISCDNEHHWYNLYKQKLLKTCLYKPDEKQLASILLNVDYVILEGDFLSKIKARVLWKINSDNNYQILYCKKSTNTVVDYHIDKDNPTIKYYKDKKNKTMQNIKQILYHYDIRFKYGMIFKGLPNINSLVSLARSRNCMEDISPTILEAAFEIKHDKYKIVMLIYTDDTLSSAEKFNETMFFNFYL